MKKIISTIILITMFQIHLHSQTKPIPGGGLITPKSVKGSIKLNENKTWFTIGPYAANFNKNKKSRATAPILGNSFVNNPNSTPLPMDNSIAISKSDFVVSVTNGGITYCDINGNTFSNTPTSWANWINDPTTFPTALFFDPRVIYDPVNDKFIIILIYEANSNNLPKIIIANSVDGDPNNGFFLNYFDGPGAGYWYDFPYLGQSDNDLFISVIQIPDGGGSILGNDVFQIEKNALYSNNNLLYAIYEDVLDYFGNNNIHICPSTHGAPELNGTIVPYGGTGIYLVSSFNGSQSTSSFSVYDIKNDFSISFNPIMDIYGVSANQYIANPNSSMQLNSSKRLKTNDSRIQSSFYLNNNLHLAFTSADNSSTGISTVYYGRLNFVLSSVDLIKIPTDVSNTNPTWQCYPSISFMGNSINDKSVYINFLYSGRNHYPGMRMVECDDILNLSTITDIKIGDNFIDYGTAGSEERWGDYTGIQRAYHYTNCPKSVFNGSFGNINNRYNEFIGENICSPSSIKETKKLENIKIYPNPFIDHIVIESSKNYKDSYLQLFDITGRLVYSSIINLIEGKNNVHLDLEKLQSSNFYIKIINNNEIVYNDVITKY